MDYRIPRLFAAVAAGAALAAFALGGGSSAPARAAAATGAPTRGNVVSFQPGTPWQDQSGSALQMHGLGIIKVGDTWYGYGEDKAGESAAGAPFQAIPCYSSTDLRHWTFQGNALTEQASGDLGPNRVVERPKVIYNATTHEYVMWMHIDSANYSAAEAGVAESPTPCGPYTYLGASQPLGFQSRDIGLFQDTDGTAYLLSEDRANGLRIDQLSADYLSVVGSGAANGGSVALMQDLEAPAMVHVGSTYYLIASHLTGWSLNDDVYATAPSPAGPWSSFQDFAPSGTDTYNTQVGNIITVAGSRGTTYIYAGDRWTPNDLGNSPMVWLPMTISAGVVNVGWETSWQLNVRTGTWQPGPSMPHAGPAVLTNNKSELDLDVASASTSSGAGIVQDSASGNSSERWLLMPVEGYDGGVYTLRNLNSGLCLDVPGGSTTVALQLDQAACDGGANQQWAFDAVGGYGSNGNVTYQIENLGDGLVLDDLGNDTTAGSIVDQYRANGGANQAWTIAPF
ncbi:MAG TPA: RICIN domain-containing protein [Actinospica sp.]|nr:RICIN domain-containing protein [Actinospica sp.]